MIDDSLSILLKTEQNFPECQSWSGHRLTAIVLRLLSLIVGISNPLSITNNHRSRNGLFFCDSAPFCKWKFGFRARAISIRRAYFWIQNFLNSSKQFLVKAFNFQGNETVHTWWLNTRISRILSTFSTIGPPKRGPSFTTRLLDRNLRNQNCT